MILSQIDIHPNASHRRIYFVKMHLKLRHVFDWLNSLRFREFFCILIMELLSIKTACSKETGRYSYEYRPVSLPLIVPLITTDVFYEKRDL